MKPSSASPFCRRTSPSTTAASRFTLKLQRRVVEQQFHDVIDQLYADVAEPRPILQD